MQDKMPALVVQVPCDGTAETNVTPAGRTLVSVTPVETAGRLFVTVMV